jgi:hypothetical protein
MAQMRGSQISSLIESLPGIANVLRSPVADALVGMIRAGARLGDFREEDAQELISYAVRRGLVGSEEGRELLNEVKGAAAKKRATKAKRAAKTTAGSSGGKKKLAPKKVANASKKRSANKALKKKAGGSQKKATAKKTPRKPAKSAKKSGGGRGR